MDSVNGLPAGSDRMVGRMRPNFFLLVAAVWVFLILWSQASQAAIMKSPNYVMNASVFHEADHNSSSSNYVLRPSMGEPVVANSSSSNYFLSQGFMYTIDVIAVTDTSFTMGLPSSGCVENQGSTDAGAECERCWIAAAEPIQTQVNCQGQSAGTSFFTFTNTGNVNENWKMRLNQTVASVFTLKVSTASDGWEATCSGNPSSGCVALNTSYSTLKTGIAPSATSSAWMWGDFATAGAQQVIYNITHSSIQS